jgi:CheY-like chemotaxis protein
MHNTALVIDDSATVRAIIALQLGRIGLTTASFPDGIATFDWLTRSHTIPALALIDINLPKISGYEITRRFKSSPHYTTTLIVLMSTTPLTLDAVRSTGASYFLRKPFTINELLSVTHTALSLLPSSFHRTHNRTGEIQ